MSKEYEEIREKIAKILFHQTTERDESDWESRAVFVKKTYIERADQILTLETPTCRLAVVRKEPNLPYTGFSALHADDMLEANFVQEVK